MLRQLINLGVHAIYKLDTDSQLEHLGVLKAQMVAHMIKRVGLQTVPNNMMDVIIVYTLAIKRLAEATSNISHITLVFESLRFLSSDLTQERIFYPLLNL